MNAIKYIGMDVHLATISIAVLDAAGKLIMELTIATQAGALLDFIRGLSGTLYVTFEEGTSAHWLYTLLEPQVAKVVVCDPRQNPRRLGEKKSDRLDARKLAELLRLGTLKPVYHGNALGPALKELVRSYCTLVSDTTRVMSRLKALYRARGIRGAGTRVYSPRFRDQWLAQLREPGARGRAERLYKQLDFLMPLRGIEPRAPCLFNHVVINYKQQSFSAASSEEELKVSRYTSIERQIPLALRTINQDPAMGVLIL